MAVNNGNSSTKGAVVPNRERTNSNTTTRVEGSRIHSLRGSSSKLANNSSNSRSNSSGSRSNSSRLTSSNSSRMDRRRSSAGIGRDNKGLIRNNANKCSKKGDRSFWNSSTPIGTGSYPKKNAKPFGRLWESSIGAERPSVRGHRPANSH